MSNQTPFTPREIHDSLERGDAFWNQMSAQRAWDLLREIARLRTACGGIADILAPVSAALMQRACGDDWEHKEDCTCYTCRAFLAVQTARTELEKLEKGVEESE